MPTNYNQLKDKNPYPLINLDKKFILFTNAKCGGTTLKLWFLDSLNFDETFSSPLRAIKNYGLLFVINWYNRYGFLNHNVTKIKPSNFLVRKFIKLYRLQNLKNVVKFIDDPSFKKIAVVRNPHDRLVSAYVDKFCGEDLNTSWVQSVIKAVNCKDDEGNYQLTFYQFVNYLANNDLTTVNAHWRHQSYIMSGIDFDSVIHLKELSVKLPELTKELQVKTTVAFVKRRQSNKYSKKENKAVIPQVYNVPNTKIIEFKKLNGYFPSKNEFYTDELKQKVKNIYKDDFDLFDFED